MVGRRGQRANVDECQLTTAAQLFVRHQNRSVHPSSVKSGSFSGALTVTPLTALTNSPCLQSTYERPGDETDRKIVLISKRGYRSHVIQLEALQYPRHQFHPLDSSPSDRHVSLDL